MRFPRRIRLALFGLVCWLPFTACTCSGPGVERVDSPRGKTLKQMKTSGPPIVPRLQGEEDLIEFDAIRIEQSGQQIYAELPYRLTAPKKGFERLLEVVRQSHPDATLPSSVEVSAEVTYTNQNGRTLDWEMVRFRLSQGGATSGQVRLTELGRVAAPTASVVRLESVHWQEGPVAVAFPTPPAVSAPVGEQSRTPLKAPEGLPFTLEFLNIDKEPSSSTLGWKRTGDEAALRKLLSESQVATPNRPAEYVTIRVTALDAEGQPVDKASKDVELPLEGSASGNHVLYQIALTAPFTLKVEVKSLKWRGRALDAKFGPQPR